MSNSTDLLLEWLDLCEFNGIPWQNELKALLITPKDWLEPGHGKLCKSCRFLASGVVPYHDPNRPHMVTCMAVGLCKVFHSGTCKGSPGLIIHHAGNEHCDRYEPEIVLNFVWTDPPYSLEDT